MQALLLLETASTTREITPFQFDVTGYLKLILVLGFVLVLLFVVLRVWLPRMTGLQHISSGPIRVIARYPLEPRKNLYIVQAAGSYLLVGTSDSGVHYLTTLDSTALESSLAVEEPVPGLDFSKLMHLLKRPRRSF